VSSKAENAVFFLVICMICIIVATECEKVVANFVNEVGVTGSAGDLLTVTLFGSFIIYVIIRVLKKRGI
jgi:formate/nitrite transporter FocA (FNT family)